MDLLAKYRAPASKLVVMPSNATGWFWHSLARETGRLGHLYSPGGQRGPWPWFPYALDNGAFACWDPKSNTFDEAKWSEVEGALYALYSWAHAAEVKPLWAIVPDVPGNAGRTIDKWRALAAYAPFKRALAVQDGMEPSDVKALTVQPDVVAIGGSTEWKWASVEKWVRNFPRVHVLRCNSPTRLYELEALGVESCDGTGWSRGDRKQTAGLEEWARLRAAPVKYPLWPHVCRQTRKKDRGLAE